MRGRGEREGGGGRGEGREREGGGERGGRGDGGLDWREGQVRVRGEKERREGQVERDR